MRGAGDRRHGAHGGHAGDALRASRRQPHEQPVPQPAACRHDLRAPRRHVGSRGTQCPLPARPRTAAGRPDPRSDRRVPIGDAGRGHSPGLDHAPEQAALRHAGDRLPPAGRAGELRRESLGQCVHPALRSRRAPCPRRRSPRGHRAVPDPAEALPGRPRLPVAAQHRVHGHRGVSGPGAQAPPDSGHRTPDGGHVPTVREHRGRAPARGQRPGRRVKRGRLQP